MLASYQKSLFATFIVSFCFVLGLYASAQSVGNSGSINGTVVDPTGAVVANATVEIHNPVSGLIAPPPPTLRESSPSPIFRSTPTT